MGLPNDEELNQQEIDYLAKLKEEREEAMRDHRRLRRRRRRRRRREEKDIIRQLVEKQLAEEKLQKK